MSELAVLAIASFLLNTIVVGGTGLLFVGRLGTRLDALSSSVELLRMALEKLDGEAGMRLLDLERRVARLEGKQ